jgi:hypothetical protein
LSQATLVLAVGSSIPATPFAACIAGSEPFLDGDAAKYLMFGTVDILKTCGECGALLFFGLTVNSVNMARKTKKASWTEILTDIFCIFSHWE